ncbi:PREDICTED: cytosolic sulfotransferase 12-like [Ipomoea nil]|uniref:cytosolic sulfotransferase 12-like n=1 Tax=Ipomoea nil TaxID=35883 RepID=UPI000900FA15|nr:PREDICTED: cytosolic sulfotransferase 12-like [Ipomoea nil]
MPAPSDDRNASNSLLPHYLQEDFGTQAFRELISSLPRERGWLTPNIYNYKGFWLGAFHLQGALRFQQHFQAQDSDIMLITLPKSGTIWLKALVFALITREQFLASQETPHPLLTNNPHELIPFVDVSYAREPTPDFPPISNGVKVRVVSTHFPYAFLPESVRKTDCKLIYLCRSPKDTVVSYWHFANRMRGENNEMKEISLEEAVENYCRGVSLGGPFWDHTLGYWKESSENPRKVLFVKYEEMKEKPEVHLRRLAAFLGCPFSEEEEEGGVVGEILRLCSFDNLSGLEVNRSGKGVFGTTNSVMFRKGEVGDWRNHLTDEMASRVDQIVEEKFNGSGLKP